jgi:hypothetical protein
MWNRSSTTHQELEGTVFDDPVDWQSVKSLANKANNTLKTIGIPWKLSCDGEGYYVTKQQDNRRASK